MELDKFTIFDAFIKQQQLYINLSINSDVLTEDNIVVSIDNKILTLNYKIVKDKYEPTLIFIYNVDFNCENQYINITYNKNNYDIPFSNINVNPSNNDIVLTTLFKNDYMLFNNFYKYYKNQGISHFYMYYNGILNEKIKSIFNKPDVTLIEWNFRYWNQNCKYVHHAQLGQMHNALYKYGKDRHKYMVFCDLDEYLYIDNDRLKDLIDRNDIDYYLFNNRWSKLIDNKTPTNLDFPFDFLSCPKQINVSSKGEFERSKCIYKLKNISTINIHHADKFSIINPQKYHQFYMYHFYEWNNKNREFVINDNKEWVNYRLELNNHLHNEIKKD